MIKKGTLFVLFLVSGISAMAQRWGGGADHQNYGWGFNFQAVFSEFKLIKNENWRNPYIDPDTKKVITDSLTSITSPLSKGIGLGLIFTKYVTKNLDLKLHSNLLFDDHTIDYQYKTPPVNNKRFSSIVRKNSNTYFEMSGGIKLKSDRIIDFRGYIILGGKWSVDMASSKKKNDSDYPPLDKFIKTKKNFLSYEAGIGFDIYFEYFKMSPEIKLNYSTRDVLIHAGSPYDSPIDKAILRSFSFGLVFQ